MLLCNVMLGECCQYIYSAVSLIQVALLWMAKIKKKKSKTQKNKEKLIDQRKHQCKTNNKQNKNTKQKIHDFIEKNKFHSVKFNTIFIFPRIKCFSPSPFESTQVFIIYNKPITEQEGLLYHDLNELLHEKQTIWVHLSISETIEMKKV